MLPLTIPETEMFNSETQEFTTLPAVQLQLEHSLISLSKWEAKWKKSFLSTMEITAEEFRDYVRCMTINKIADDSCYDRLTTLHEKLIRAYIEDPMSATRLPNSKSMTRRNRIVTSEQIYGWMIDFNIPFNPCEKWHLNRLIMLINVCGIQQSPSKKRSTKDRYAAQNAQYNRMRNKAKR